MACNQTLTGILQDCAPTMGGIRWAAFAAKSDVTVTVTTNKISAIAMATGAKFKRYRFRRDTGSMTSTLNVDNTTGTHFYTTELALSFAKMETTKKIEMSALSLSELAAIVEDCNGTIWFLGYDEPVVVTAGSGTTGTAHGDKNGYDITLTDTSKDYPYEILTGTGGVDLSTIID